MSSTAANPPSRLIARRLTPLGAPQAVEPLCRSMLTAELERGLDVLESGVADILAVHHVDHVFGNVLGVIADALERACDPHDVERAPDGAWVFHHEGHALALDRLVLLVED